MSTFADGSPFDGARSRALTWRPFSDDFRSRPGMLNDREQIARLGRQQGRRDREHLAELELEAA